MEIVGFWCLCYFVRSALFTSLTSEWRSESLFIHRYVPETDTPANMSGQNAALEHCVAKCQHSISKVMATACMAMSISEATKLVEIQHGVSALFVVDNGKGGVESFAIGEDIFKQ